MELNGKAAEAQRRRQMVVDALMRACGVYEGAAVDPSVLGAIDMVTAAVTLTVADDKLGALLNAIATLRDLARTFGAELPERAQEAEPQPEDQQADPPHDAATAAARAVEDSLREHRDDHITSLAHRLRPARVGERPALNRDYAEDHVVIEQPHGA